MPPRYGQQGPFHGVGHLQYSSSQQHGALPPPQHLGTPSFAAGGSSTTSPFGLGANINNFDGRLQDGMLSGQMSFARGVPGQAHQAYDGMPHNRETKDDSRIRNVWKHNLAQEMANLRQLVEEYPYIAMDTEFPGIVARPIGQFTTKADYHYQTLRCNVDLLKMIQLGITLFKEDGSLPPADHPSTGTSTNKMLNPYMQATPAPYSWQFNFNFSLESDMYASESTNMLSKAGIDFDRHAKNGIDPSVFGSLLISSGLVLDSDVHWISFHSGYDFGYLMKLMVANPLPANETEFHNLLERFFPSLFDIKFMLKHASAKGSVNNNQPLTQESQLVLTKLFSKSGLQDIAEELAVQRIGQAHQAGSDSLLTGQVYFKMRERIFGGTIDQSKYSGQVWGLNAQMPTSSNLRDLNAPNMNGAVIYNQQGQVQNQGQNGNAPSTPQAQNVGIAGSSQTPVPPQSAHGMGAGLGGMMGSITPGPIGVGAGGGFGHFQYSKGMS